MLKRSLCVEYVVEDAWYNETILATFENFTEADCILRCARHQECYAHNILRSRWGLCEILCG